MCLVKAQVRSALNLCDGKIYFRKFFLFASCLSHSLSPLLFTGVYFFLLIVVAFLQFRRVCGLHCKSQKKCEKIFLLFRFAKKIFHFGGHFLHYCVIKVPRRQLDPQSHTQLFFLVTFTNVNLIKTIFQ